MWVRCQLCGVLFDHPLRHIFPFKLSMLNFERQNQVAIAMLQAGRNVDAVAAYCLIPEHARTASVWSNLGLAYQQSGLLESALQSLDRALVLAPDFVDAWYNRGVTLNHLGRNQEAKSTYEKVLEREPTHLGATLNLGICLVALCEYKEALSVLDKVLITQADQGLAWHWQGMAWTELEKWGEAAAAFEQAASLLTDHYETWIGLAGAYLELKDFERTLEAVEKALQYSPNDFTGLYYRGNALRELERFQEAIVAYESALLLEPKSIEALANIGVCHERLHDFQTALYYYDQILVIDPNHTVGLFNSANALADLGRLHEALNRYEALYATGNPTKGYRVNKSFCLLKLGRYEQAWPLYEGRWENPHPADAYQFDQPIWLGETPLNGRRILLHCEQGLGDTLQFCRYVKQVKAQGAYVILRVQDSLVSLMSTLQNVDLLLGKSQPLPVFDVHCPLLSLPLAFKTTRASVDGTVPYLWADNLVTEIWKKRLGRGAKPVVGLAWQGAKAYRFDFRRSMPLAALTPLLALSDQFDFVVLQKDLTDLDLEVLSKHPLLKVLPEQTDFADAAALVAALDLVVSVDTALGHLAGVLGKPAAILLPTVADWRWVVNEARSPWYPNTRLFWQSQVGDWMGAVQALVEYLRGWDKPSLA